MYYFVLICIPVCLSISCIFGQSIEDKNPVEEMVWVSDMVDDTFSVQIVLPKEYHLTDTTYPIILHLDSDVSLELITSLSNWLTLTGTIQPVIIVGIAYKKDWQQKRARDMTPVSGDASFQQARPMSGQADNFLRAIQHELYPALEKHRIDWQNKTITGHSLGGLFALYALTRQPAMFDNYLMVAPSFNWYDNYALKLPDDLVHTHPSPIRVISAVGLLDRPKLITAWRTMNERMSEKYSYMDWMVKPYSDLDHFTVVPVAFMDGLIALHGR